MKMIKVVRTINGKQEETTFSQISWDLLGANKEGWVEVSDKPAELLPPPGPSEQEILIQKMTEENLRVNHELSDTKKAHEDLTEELRDTISDLEKAKTDLAKASTKIVKLEKQLADKPAAPSTPTITPAAEPEQKPA